MFREARSLDSRGKGFYVARQEAGLANQGVSSREPRGVVSRIKELASRGRRSASRGTELVSHINADTRSRRNGLLDPGHRRTQLHDVDRAELRVRGDHGIGVGREWAAGCGVDVGECEPEVDDVRSADGRSGRERAVGPSVRLEAALDARGVDPRAQLEDVQRLRRRRVGDQRVVGERGGAARPRSPARATSASTKTSAPSSPASSPTWSCSTPTRSTTSRTPAPSATPSSTAASSIPSR